MRWAGWKAKQLVELEEHEQRQLRCKAEKMVKGTIVIKLQDELKERGKASI